MNREEQIKNNVPDFCKKSEDMIKGFWYGVQWADSNPDGDIVVKYYKSKECPQMLFGSREDADYFDNILSNYIHNDSAIAEFKTALDLYPSFYVVQLRINFGTFHFDLVGPESDKLILACENMIGGWEGLEDDNCYTCAMNYIFHKLYPNLNILTL